MRRVHLYYDFLFFFASLAAKHTCTQSLLGGQGPGGMPEMAEPHDGHVDTDATDDDDWVTEEDDEEEQEANEVEWLQQLLRRHGAAPGMMSGMQMLELLHASGHSSTQDVDVDNMSYEELQDLCERMGKVNVGLKPEQIAERTVLYTYGKEVHAACTEEDTCTVCMYEFEAGDELRKLSCPHYFHVDCIDQWLAESKKCPVCKVEVLKKVPLAKTAAAQPTAAASAHKTPSPKTAKKKRAPGSASTRRGPSAGAATPAAAPAASTPSPPKAKRKMPAASSSASASASPPGPTASSSRAAPAAPAAKLSASASSASAPLDARTPPTKKAKKSSKNKAAGASAPGPMFLR